MFFSKIAASAAMVTVAAAQYNNGGYEAPSYETSSVETPVYSSVETPVYSSAESTPVYGETVSSVSSAAYSSEVSSYFSEVSSMPTYGAPAPSYSSEESTPSTSSSANTYGGYSSSSEVESKYTSYAISTTTSCTESASVPLSTGGSIYVPQGNATYIYVPKTTSTITSVITHCPGVGGCYESTTVYTTVCPKTGAHSVPVTTATVSSASVVVPHTETSAPHVPKTTTVTKVVTVCPGANFCYPTTSVYTSVCSSTSTTPSVPLSTGGSVSSVTSSVAVPCNGYNCPSVPTGGVPVPQGNSTTPSHSSVPVPSPSPITPYSNSAASGKTISYAVAAIAAAAGIFISA